MIAQLRGNVAVRAEDHLIVDCNGVGYMLFASARTLQGASEGKEVTLQSQLIVRDDAMQLYGFAGAAEKELFGQLISVAGVGPKMALSALSGSTPAELRRAIAAGDSKRFQAVPGIGKKTAERVIVELRDKVSDSLSQEIAGTSNEGAIEAGDARLLAREGLMTLGYELNEAEQLLDSIGADIEISEPEDMIAAALRGAASKAA